MNHLIKALCLSGFAGLSACATLEQTITPPSLTHRVEAVLAAKAPIGTRFGVVVADETGREIVAINADQRFIPASNTKIFTTATAFARLEVAKPATGTSVALITPAKGVPDVVLQGEGDASLADGAECVTDCLSELADAVVRSGIKRVGDVIGDDRLFPDQRWGPGWSWDDMATLSGAAVSALTVNNNILRVTVTPGAVGQPVEARWREGDDYLELINEVRAVNPGEIGEIGVERLPGSNRVRLYGSVPAGSPAFDVTVAVEDPAHFTAWRFKRLLTARGIEVTGNVVASHRSPANPERLPPERLAAASQATPLARLSAPPVIDDLHIINKQSQNLHAELTLRRLSVEHGGTGGIEDGLKFVRETLMNARPEPGDYDFSDGSGLSTYNRVTPRLMVRFLNWTQDQSWGAGFRDTLPIGGVDGSLRRRFKGTPLEGKIFAKTGRLNSVNSLSGFVIAKSGRRLTFTVFANDRPPEGGSAVPAMDQVIGMIAAEN